MSVEQAIREGDLKEALAEVQAEVRKDASNAKTRVLLFQLLVVTGQWERALTQLSVLGEMDPQTLPMVQTYREAIRCEMLRAEVFAGKRSPLIFGDPEQWIALVLEALRLTGAGEYAHSQEAREEGFDQAPATSGTLNATAFEWIADADPRLGPILEAIVNGRYYWIPFHRIRTINIEEPADLRDMVWTPAQFTWANGGQVVGLVPTRYPGSETSPDDAVRLSRKTEWDAHDADVYLGLGQRVLATDADEYPLMNVREVTLDTVDSGGDESAAGDTPADA